MFGTGFWALDLWCSCRVLEDVLCLLSPNAAAQQWSTAISLANGSTESGRLVYMCEPAFERCCMKACINSIRSVCTGAANSRSLDRAVTEVTPAVVAMGADKKVVIPFYQTFILQ